MWHTDIEEIITGRTKTNEVGAKMGGLVMLAAALHELLRKSRALFNKEKSE